MNKEILINQVVGHLELGGFNISARCNIRPRSFDIAARLEDLLLLIKILSNIDGLKEETAREMISLSEYLEGVPLVVGEKTRDHSLESTVVYYRYGIPSINVETLYDYFIEDLPPLVYAAPGGLYVSIDGSILRDMRLSSNQSIGALAAELGVSRRTISKYEEEGMDMSVDIVTQLEELFNHALAQPIDFINVEKGKRKMKMPSTQSEPGISIKSILSGLGLDVIPVSQAPFSAVSFEHSQDNNNESLSTILTGFSNYSGAMIKRAKLMSSISDVAKTYSMFIVNGPCKSDCVDNTVLIEKSEIEAMDDFMDLVTLIFEKIKKN